MDHNSPEKHEKLKSALAEYLEIDVENIHGYVLGVENTQDGELIFSAVWSTSSHWALTGYIRELEVNQKNFRAQQQLESMLTEEPSPE